MEELFTIKEVAEKLKISVSSIYRYVESGVFPHTKIGSNIRFTNDHIEAFLSRRMARTEHRDIFSQMPNQIRAAL
jgi:excisionase family DNA binding protein